MSNHENLLNIKSIAGHDKKIIDLEHLVKIKKAQMTKNYEILLKNVKSNPYLQAGIDEYKNYFKETSERKDRQINALKTLLNSLDKDNISDRNEIKREIKLIEKEL